MRQSLSSPHECSSERILGAARQQRQIALAGWRVAAARGGGWRPHVSAMKQSNQSLSKNLQVAWTHGVHRAQVDACAACMQVPAPPLVQRPPAPLPADARAPPAGCWSPPGSPGCSASPDSSHRMSRSEPLFPEAPGLSTSGPEPLVPAAQPAAGLGMVICGVYTMTSVQRIISAN